MVAKRIVHFRNRYIAAWNANTEGAEHVPGQFNYLSTSEDFERWTKPVRLFTAEGGSINPVQADNQWQPAFINYHDRILYSAWCTFTGERTFVSSSTDGVKWTNVEVPTAPRALEGKVVGFPTTHGLLTSKGVMVFPCSLPYKGKFVVGDTRYAAMLLSTDGGKTWEWSDPIEAVSWSEAGEDPSQFGGELITLWEPSVYVDRPPLPIDGGHLSLGVRKRIEVDAQPANRDAGARVQRNSVDAAATVEPERCPRGIDGEVPQGVQPQVRQHVVAEAILAGRDLERTPAAGDHGSEFPGQGAR